MGVRVWGEERPVRAFNEIRSSISGGSEGGVCVDFSIRKA
jgi:hypothetical protein